MSKKKTSEEFIAEARKVHGDRYDYSKTQYVDSDTKVCIICPVHGEFQQKARSHLSGHGCQMCSDGKTHYKKGTLSNRRKWYRNNIIEEAKKYTRQVDFKFGSSGAYDAAQRLGMLNELHQYWEKDTYQRGYWTKENCMLAASECENRSELMRKYGGAYAAALRNRWIDELFPTNEKSESEKIHCVYGISFKDGSIYIGRTLVRRVEKRYREHINGRDNTGTVFEYIQKTGELPSIEVLKKDLNRKDSLIYEDYYVNKFKKDGKNVLNRQKTGIHSGSCGALGFGHLSYEYCYSIAKTCKTKSEFQHKNASAYLKANKMGWSKDYTWFEEVHKPKGYWDVYENCYAEFVKCGSSIERLRRENSVCYTHAAKNGFTAGWRKKRIAHNKKWTIETLSEVVKKYPKQNDLRKHEGGAYMALQRMGLLYEFYPRQNDKPFGYWNVFEHVQKEAEKYKSRWDFGKHNGSAYESARRNGWMDILFPLQK